MLTTYDHPDYRHLLAAVRSSPDDDLPRLVLADWLEERDTECDVARAKFIRAEITAHRWATTPSHLPGGTQAGGGPAGAAVAESGQLLKVWGRAWARVPFSWNVTSWPLSPNPRESGVQFVRGFVRSLWCRYVGFFAVGADVARDNPVRSVSVIDREPLRQGGYWCWTDCDDRPPQPAADLTTPIAQRLTRYAGASGGRNRYYRYRTRVGAISSLGRAMLSWARSPQNAAAA